MVPLNPPASRSAIIPVFCLSHLIPFCHLGTRLFFSIIFPPHPVVMLLLRLYIQAIMFHSFVSIHLYVALLIPSHLLSSALVPPVSLPALLKQFPACCSISAYPSPFPPFFPIRFLSAISSIHPPPSFSCKVYHHSLPQAFPSPSYTFIPFRLYFL